MIYPYCTTFKKIIYSQHIIFENKYLIMKEVKWTNFDAEQSEEIKSFMKVSIRSNWV